MEAAWSLGSRDVELSGWIETSRTTFARLGARPLLTRLDEAIAHGDAAASGDAARPIPAADVSVRTAEG